MVYTYLEYYATWKRKEILKSYNMDEPAQEENASSNLQNSSHWSKN